MVEALQALLNWVETGAMMWQEHRARKEEEKTRINIVYTRMTVFEDSLKNSVFVSHPSKPSSVKAPCVFAMDLRIYWASLPLAQHPLNAGTKLLLSRTNSGLSALGETTPHLQLSRHS